MTKKIGKYTVRDEGMSDELISNLTWELDSQNRSVVQWDWPSNQSVKVALVYPLKESDAECTLEDLLERSAVHTVCSKEIDKHYCKPKGAEQKMCYKVFPVVFGEGNQIIVINQTSGNTTGLLFSKIRIGYSLMYDKLLLSDYKKVKLTVYGELAENELVHALMYARYSHNKCICNYPLVHTQTECYVKVDEDIRVLVREKYKEQVEVYDTVSALR